jgi:hypothetical protein
MITALVHYLGENDAGPGFYAYAQRLGVLVKGANANQRLQFWTSQVQAVHARYA